MRRLHDGKILGGKTKNSQIIEKISSNDKIILFSTLDLKKGKNISFIAYTMVDETIKNDKSLYDHYNSQKKLKLKGMKYFTRPIIAKDLYKDLRFLKRGKKHGNYLNSEYREINKEDFYKILNKSSLSKEYPTYFEKMTVTMDEFLINSIIGIYTLLRKTGERNQIEIKTFTKLLHSFLQPYEINKSYSEIEEFYARNAWKLDFKHNPSRDPDKFVTIYNRHGKKLRFSYISLE